MLKEILFNSVVMEFSEHENESLKNFQKKTRWTFCSCALKSSKELTDLDWDGVRAKYT